MANDPAFCLAESRGVSTSVQVHFTFKARMPRTRQGKKANKKHAQNESGHNDELEGFFLLFP